MNIPIYRAKKIDTDEFIEGYLNYTSFDNKYILWNGTDEKLIEINPLTLSIHFPDMIDSYGNKVFASLQKDGSYGSIIEFSSHWNDFYKIDDKDYEGTEEIVTSTVRYKDQSIIFDWAFGYEGREVELKQTRLVE